ncbi:RNase H domain-containing protein [Trichonephila clavipes]|nr:RNase H domain-containing protein [Trichonephila clavipes]
MQSHPFVRYPTKNGVDNKRLPMAVHIIVATTATDELTLWPVVKITICPGNDVKISIRNHDHCSVFRTELIAISGALDHALNSYKDSTRILTYSRSSIQYLKNCPQIMDSTGLDILFKLVRLGQITCGCAGNEVADELVGRGCDLSNPSSTVLIHSEIPSFQKNKMNLTWRSPPAHHWYTAKSPSRYLQ